MFNKYYDKVVVLSQPERKDRRKEFDKHADLINLRYEYFDSLAMATPRDSFNHSHYNILKNFIKSDANRILVLEDDCRFRNMNKLDEIHADENKFAWNPRVLYYGINARPYPDHKEPTYASNYFRRVYCGYTTHAIGYYKGAAEYITENYDPNSGMMYDAWLSENLSAFDAMVTVPFLAVQAPSHSDLWNRNVDYTDTFKASEEYLKSIK
jgi:hypothetical protein